MFWVYILRDEAANRLYVGSTTDLDRRLEEHRTKKPSYKLIYKESRLDKDSAFQREKYLKTGNGRRFLKNLLASKS